MRALTGLGPPHRRTHARLHSPVTWSTARTRSPSPRRHVPMLQAQVERRTGDGRRRWRQSTPGAQRGEHAGASTLDHRHAHHVPRVESRGRAVATGSGRRRCCDAA